MMYMLDTNICIYIIKNRPPQVIKTFEKLNVGEVAISSVTLSELYAGVEKSYYPEKNKAALNQFIGPLEVLSYDRVAAEYYGKIRAYLEISGTPIGGYDMMIGAHALSSGLILVTNNIREFERIRNLRLENWI